MEDRHTRVLPTIIAGCLVYLCVADALQGAPVSAQTYATKRPGEQTGPAEVIIVGWRNLPQGGLPVQIASALPARGSEPIRVVLAGWEEGPLVARGFSGEGLPVRGTEGPRPAPAVRVRVVAP
jgi:hypothetical protein